MDQTETRTVVPDYAAAPPGAIAPAGLPANIETFAQDCYLAIPKEERTDADWFELQHYAQRGDWEQLRAIYSHYTQSSTQITDNSNRSQVDNSKQETTSLHWADQRQWTAQNEQTYYTDDNSTDVLDQSQDYYWDGRQWVHSTYAFSDDRRWTDNSSLDIYAPTYAPQTWTHAPIQETYYVDNSVVLAIDGSFNGNWAGNSETMTTTTQPQISGGGGGGSEFDPIKFVLFIFSVGLAAILATGIWANVRSNGTISSPAAYPAGGGYQ